MKATKTVSGQFTVFHKKDAGAPEYFKGGPWFFEPTGIDSGGVYSKGYKSSAKALEAAEAWEERAEFESNQMPGGEE